MCACSRLTNDQLREFCERPGVDHVSPGRDSQRYPNGMGDMFFAVLAAAAQIERNYIREKTLEGQQAAAAKGNHGGRPKVIDDDSLLFARALKNKGVPVPEIAKKLTIKTGKNAGKNPSVASLYRALAEAEQAEAPAGPEIIAPRRPTRVDFTGPGSGSDPELMERLQHQVSTAAPTTMCCTRSLYRPRTRRTTSWRRC
ncbi:recombinase family protein [Streptomyces eurythermus]|uniref:recombinase family protein n=1 Tax=Streptomyces eurythermus TaxID=42237 RepID=UPI0036D2696F